MPNLAALAEANSKRWAAAKLTRDFSSAAKRLVLAKAHYKAVETRTGVPWHIIAVIHEREASQNWAASLAQGDPFDKVSVHVPAGRGPFKSWEDAAVDALMNCAPFAARNKNWSVGGALTELEGYNGLGYSVRGVPSPYIWAGTDQYVSGKYVKDGVYDPAVIDKQLGCAGLLMAMMALDPSITFTGIKIAPQPVPKSPQPSITNPSKGSIGEAIAALFSLVGSFFKRK